MCVRALVCACMLAFMRALGVLLACCDVCCIDFFYEVHVVNPTKLEHKSLDRSCFEFAPVAEISLPCYCTMSTYVVFLNNFLSEVQSYMWVQKSYV